MVAFFFGKISRNVLEESKIIFFFWLKILYFFLVTTRQDDKTMYVYVSGLFTVSNAHKMHFNV